MAPIIAFPIFRKYLPDPQTFLFALLPTETAGTSHMHAHVSASLSLWTPTRYNALMQGLCVMFMLRRLYVHTVQMEHGLTHAHSTTVVWW